MFFACLTAPQRIVSVCVRESVLKWMSLGMQRMHVCMHKAKCVCKYLCARSPLGAPPSFSIFNVWCQDLTLAVCLSPFLAKRPNPTRTLQKDYKTHSFKNEWKVFLFFPLHSLLKIITPRIGKFCQSEDDMTYKPSRGKKHCLEVICPVRVFSWSLCSAEPL